MSHWTRDDKPDFDAVIAGFDTPATAAAVFDNLEAAEACTLAQPRLQHELAAARWTELAKGEEDRAAKRDILLGVAQLDERAPHVGLQNDPFGACDHVPIPEPRDESVAYPSAGELPILRLKLRMTSFALAR